MAKQTIRIGTQADDGTGDSIRVSGVRINENFTELFATSSAQSQIHFIENNITSTLTNSDIVLAGNGTGIVRMSTALTIDSTVRLSDNNITTNTSNANLVLSASGTGIVQLPSAPDIDGGEIDGIVIGATTPASATFSTLNYNNSALIIDGVTVADNTISTNASNSNIEFSPAGSGYVDVSGIKLPNTDGTVGQVLSKTENGFLIKTKDSFIEIFDIEGKLRVGDKLGL